MPKKTILRIRIKKVLKIQNSKKKAKKKNYNEMVKESKKIMEKHNLTNYNKILKTKILINQKKLPKLIIY